MRAAPALVLAIAVATVQLAGCAGLDGDRSGVVVTGQPVVDAYQRLGGRSDVVGLPSWVILDEPWDAARLGRPFSIQAEEVIALRPELVVDQAHPLVSGPDREALAAGVKGAGIDFEELPTAPELGTVRALIEFVADRLDKDPEPLWTTITDGLAAVAADVEGLERPRALVLFPAGLTAGSATDVDVILGLAGIDNVGRLAGLEGYRQISDEAVQRTGVDLVIATATLRKPAEQIARMPMLDGTAVAGHPERVLVVDPSRTTRVGPYVDEAVRMLATWAHPELPGPVVHAAVTPTRAAACEAVRVDVATPGANLQLGGQGFAPGNVTIPALPDGHYRLRVEATDASGAAFIDLLLTVEGDACEPTA